MHGKGTILHLRFYPDIQVRIWNSHTIELKQMNVTVCTDPILTTGSCAYTLQACATIGGTTTEQTEQTEQCPLVVSERHYTDVFSRLLYRQRLITSYLLS